MLDGYWYYSPPTLFMLIMPALVRSREFITSTYPSMKQANPDLPILIRQAKGTPARVFARFGACFQFPSCSLLANWRHLVERGVEKHVEVEGLPASDVASRISQLLGTA